MKGMHIHIQLNRLLPPQISQRFPEQVKAQSPDGAETDPELRPRRRGQFWLWPIINWKSDNHT
jgi:hypothetical protein